MTVEQIVNDPDLRAQLFPVTRRKHFLAHAAVAPITQPAVDRIRRAAEEGASQEQETEVLLQELDQCRRTAARLLHVDPSEVALVGPTAFGLNLVAQGIDFQPGDEVVFYPDDYPANVYPWMRLAERGVKLVRLEPGALGRLTPELVLDAVGPRTRLVALASCHFLSGYLLDYRTIGEELRRRDVLFCLDGIQSLGAAPMDAACCDFLSADSHKWLLGPLGAGIFYVRKERQDLLRPALVGAWNIRSPGFIAQPQIECVAGARRYECGALYALGILGMRASMELLLEVGIEAIRERLLSLHAFLADGLRKRGWSLLAEEFPAEARSGIVTATHDGIDLAAAAERLKEQNIVVSLRWDRQGKRYLRFSPHFYNTHAELAQAVAALDRVASH
ncbi:Selenocysteine lyase/Cysteine desulfurase (Modular protein) [Methylacidimicrobium sp. AP8]|uniref:aminotransferase class V-fold PLP-dependent enzyme n=1 Tax=Methylacidimicrobium sp. AP8 TaxID=2730359 RepID=UPI0018C0ABCC|nr:aminotransferase class V-fold PLP-dependent enzyme [Methylacidimicrobium sp. AP8]CAB4242721.1 Selenocysteine lyase/Cysteine desulfurase (Modular protein) [Methylacidimicrobium sp. AP8]